MIYILRQRDTEFVKIGFTKSNYNLKKRIKAIQSTCPNKIDFEAKINGSKLKESYLHSIYLNRHHHNEWFKLTKDEVKRMIEKYKDFTPTEHGINRLPRIYDLTKRVW
jgi:hypothetical protein